MIHSARLQIGLLRNSKPSSQRNGLVSRSSEPLVGSQVPYIFPCEGRRTPSIVAHQHHFNTCPAACLLFDDSDSSIKTHSSDQTPSSGLVQHIFSSPPRLRLCCLLAHIRCRRGAKLKRLCIILRPRERAREAALLPSTAGVRRRGNLVHRPDSPAVNRLKEQIRLLDFAPALV
jgi:hypothetical protein